MNESLLISPDVDFNQALPIQQKRIIAFINNFTMNTVSFLNTFAQTCESRLMDFDFKLQKVDASLKILESQLTSVYNGTVDIKEDEFILPEIQTQNDYADEVEVHVKHGSQESIKTEEPKMSENPRFNKYVKMVQVGVPLPAVKLKMQSEGLDPSILDEILKRDNVENKT